jgi:hypothetical protein
MNMVRNAPFVACFAIAAAGSVASAQLTHYVPFEDGYTVGGDLNAQGGSDLGFGTNLWFDGSPAGEGSFIVEGSLEANGVDTLGNSATTPGPFNLAFYTFNTNPFTGNGEPEDALQPGVHWLSFIAQCTTEADFGGLSLVKFFGPEILYIGKVGGNGGTEWGIDPGGNQQSAGGDVNQPTFIVVKLTIGPGANDDTAEMFVNPDPGSTPPATADVTVSFNEDPSDNRAIDEIRIGGQNGAFAIDEIRIGATFADVAPGTPIQDCPADLAEPFGILDLADINAFVTGFTTMDPIADLNGDGIFDLGDVTAFVNSFTAGCP